MVGNFSGSRWWGEVGEEVRRGGRHRDEEDDEEEEDEGGEEEEEEEVQLEASRTGGKQQQNWVRSRRVCGGSKAAGGSFRGWWRHLETSPPHKNRPPQNMANGDASPMYPLDRRVTIFWVFRFNYCAHIKISMSTVIKPKQLTSKI